MELTEKQIQILRFMQDSGKSYFSHRDAIELFDWEEQYAKYINIIKKTKFAFYSMMSRLEKKGLVRKEYNLWEFKGKLQSTYLGYELTSIGKNLEL